MNKTRELAIKRLKKGNDLQDFSKVLIDLIEDSIINSEISEEEIEEELNG